MCIRDSLILGPAGHRRVVIDEDGQVVVGFQLVAQGNVAPAEIGAEDDAAGFLLGNAGNTDADGGNILRGQLRLVQELGDARGHIAHNVGVGTLGQGRGFGLAQDLAILADQACLLYTSSRWQTVFISWQNAMAELTSMSISSGRETVCPVLLRSFTS